MIRIRNLIRYGALAAGVIGLGACDLAVENPNQPGTEKVLATPADFESLLSAYYKRWHDGVYRTTGNIQGMANVQSFQNYSSLANDGQNARVGIPRPGNDNSIGNTTGGIQQRLYQVENEVARVASNLLAQFNVPNFTLGTPAQDLRAKAFGEFLRGVSLGYIALFYDSSAIVTPGQAGEVAGDLKDYREVMDSAIIALQRSIDTASHAAASGAGGFPLPATWIPSPTTFSAAEFIRLVKSYRARFRAGVARTPAERADISAGGLVDWAAVIADAQGGITANHANITNTVSGPFNGWAAQYDTYGLWHQMPAFVIGMGDGGSNYATWIATPLAQRGSGNVPFFMDSPDLRFPQGATRAAQQADFAITSCQGAAATCKRYFANRLGNDQLVGDGWGWSNYDWVRAHSWRVSGDGGTGENGTLVFFTKAENDLLEAEGHLRKPTPDYAAAMALINKTRTAGMVSGVATGGGLPALTVATGTDPVPGGAACVPKVPQGPAFTTVGCGNMMEAMKYEKRIETAYTAFANWYVDMRGWGDLAEGTPLFWATPYQDLQARLKPIYSTGTGAGTAPNSAAAKGTYGW